MKLSENRAQLSGKRNLNSKNVTVIKTQQLSETDRKFNLINFTAFDFSETILKFVCSLERQKLLRKSHRFSSAVPTTS